MGVTNPNDPLLEMLLLVALAGKKERETIDGVKSAMREGTKLLEETIKKAKEERQTEEEQLQRIEEILKESIAAGEKLVKTGLSDIGDNLTKRLEWAGPRLEKGTQTLETAAAAITRRAAEINRKLRTRTLTVVLFTMVITWLALSTWSVWSIWQANRIRDGVSNADAEIIRYIRSQKGTLNQEDADTLVAIQHAGWKLQAFQSRDVVGTFYNGISLKTPKKTEGTFENGNETILCVEKTQ